MHLLSSISDKKFEKNKLYHRPLAPVTWESVVLLSCDVNLINDMYLLEVSNIISKHQINHKIINN